MPTFRDGQVNIAGLTNPGVYVDIIPPTAFISGVPTFIEGVVGVASWGPVGSAKAFSSLDGGAGIYGLAQVRPFDMMTHAMVGFQQGSVVAYYGVRVTDGTDTAATASVPGGGGTFTAKYTGTRGNAIAIGFQKTVAAGAYACVVQFPGRQPERFDNITQSLASLAVGTAGTGYTSVPTLNISAPAGFGAVQASAQASLTVVSAALGAAGTGYAANDLVTLSNGVKIKVLTVSSGAIATLSVQTGGSLASGSVPANPVAQVSTTGSGTGATFALSWGLGASTIQNAGSGYSSTPTVTLTGGGGTGGTYTPVSSFWGALAAAINNGTTQRGASNYVVFTPGSSTSAPTLNTAILLSGGTDGAAGVGTAQMVGQDVQPRTGMYALRGSKIDAFALCDLTDSSTWGVQTSFAISETCLAVVTTASGDSIANCIATRAGVGIDDTNIWIIEGDWPTVYDTQNSFKRLVSPQAVALGLLGNLSPEQSPINKGLIPVIGTQTSSQGILTASVDEAAAETGGIDLIGKSPDLNEDFFSFLTGRNASSNTAANGIEYTRLTNFIARSLEGSATRAIVGLLQSTQINDPTRLKASAILNSFFQTLANPALGSGGYGLIDTFSVVCDNTNNTPATQAQGFLFAFVSVRYLNVVRYFVIKLNGGGNVTVTQQSSTPAIAQFIN